MGSDGETGSDPGQDDTLGEEDQAAATAGDFGPDSGFGMSQADAEAEAAAANANAAAAGLGGFGEESLSLSLSLNPEVRALGVLGMLEALTPSFRTPGFADSFRADALVGNPHGISNDSLGSTPGDDPDDSDGGPDTILARYRREVPGLLTGQQAIEATAPVVVPRPEYEYLQNWWEGNEFFPAPITRRV